MISRITPFAFQSKFKTYNRLDPSSNAQATVESFCNDHLIDYKKDVINGETITSFEVKDDFDYTVERMLYFNDINYSKEKRF